MEHRKKKISNRMTSLGIILLSFLGIILIGAVLLSCPFAQKGDGLRFVDAFFISTSAVCVTGLSPVIDISECLNLFGRIVLALLIEIGGLGFVTFVMFIAIILGFKISFGQRLLIKEALNQDAVGGIVVLLKKIVFTAIGIQLFGTILNFIDFFFLHHLSFSSSLGYAIFHAISSFNNAGFDLFGSSSLMAYTDDLLLNFSTCLMIITGGIGFIVIFDIVQKKKFSKLTLHSKVVLTTTAFLLLVGTLLYKLLNWNELTWIQSFFMSVTSRTAGFYSVDMATHLSYASVTLTLFLMFVGAAPASTGGGIKVTTLFTMFSSFRSFATGSNESHAFRRKIQDQQIIKAFVLSTFAFAFIILIIAILFAIEGQKYSFGAVVFEVVSAFSTTGLSLGITPSLTSASKILLCIAMFVGRLGPITFISLFQRNANSTDKDSVRFVEENIIIG